MMSADANRLAPFVLLVVLSLIMPSSAEYQPIYNQNLMMGMRTIEYQLEKDFMNKPCTLSIEYLKEISLQYLSWPEDLRNALRRMARSRLIIDIALAPMQLEKPPELEEIKRQYKRFRSAYRFGTRIAGERFQLDDINNLLLKIIGASTKTLVFADFVNAKNEAVGFLNAMNHLGKTGLMYQNLEDYELMINLVNDPRYLPLFVHVFPAMEHLNDVEKLKKLFLDKLYLVGYKSIYPKKVETPRIEHVPGFLQVLQPTSND